MGDLMSMVQNVQYMTNLVQRLVVAVRESRAHGEVPCRDRAAVLAVLAELTTAPMEEVLPSEEELGALMVALEPTKPSARVRAVILERLAPVINAFFAEIGELSRQLHCAKYPGEHQVPNTNGTTSLGCNGCGVFVERTNQHQFIDCVRILRQMSSRTSAEREKSAIRTYLTRIRDDARTRAARMKAQTHYQGYAETAPKYEARCEAYTIALTDLEHYNP